MFAIEKGKAERVSPWTDEAFLRSVHIVPDTEPPEEQFHWRTPVLIAMFAVSCVLWAVVAFAFIWLGAML